MSNFIRKLASRKLWLAIAGVATGIAIALGANATEVSQISGAVTAIISLAIYIITEGKIDAAAIKTAAEVAAAVQAAVDTVKASGGASGETKQVAAAGTGATTNG